MPAGAPSWNTVRIHGTWVNQNGSRKAGAYTVTVPVRVINATNDLIVPAGKYAAGNLNTSASAPSLDFQAPATDDPDNSPTGFKISIQVTFTDGSPKELYVLDVPVALTGDDDGIDLADVILVDTLPDLAANVLIRGIPGGVAALDAEGFVVDADGNQLDLSRYVPGVLLDDPGDPVRDGTPVGALVFSKA